MLNHGAGQYIAWKNLSELIKSNIRKYKNGPVYQFQYVPPKTTVRAKLLPYDQWKSSKCPITKTNRKNNHSSTLFCYVWVFSASQWVDMYTKFFMMTIWVINTKSIIR